MAGTNAELGLQRPTVSGVEIVGAGAGAIGAAVGGAMVLEQLENRTDLREALADVHAAQEAGDTWVAVGGEGQDFQMEGTPDLVESGLESNLAHTNDALEILAPMTGVSGLIGAVFAVRALHRAHQQGGISTLFANYLPRVR